MFSIWTFNTFDQAWEFEFEGTRKECIEYINLATDSFRMWDFAIVHPGNREKWDNGIRP